MSGILPRLLYAAFFGLAFSLAFFFSYDREVNGPVKEGKPRYRSYLPCITLPIFMLVLWVINWKFYGLRYSLEWLLSTGFSVVVQIAVYYSILLLVMPRLRKKYLSFVCAGVWFLPYFLYLLVGNGVTLPRPLVVISLRGIWGKVMLAIWVAGFAGVLLWRTVSHFVFRHQILKDIREPDLAVRQLWALELQRAGIRQREYTLVISPHVKTPLSIGFFSWSIRVVLPERSYTKEELSLIFRHELVHICREDSFNKFFFTFCTAMCWFNPLMWKAMRRSAEDMELSCDETVLQDADENTRQDYARLLLAAAGDERGFTTCLSASAEAMRYRLKNVVKPLERENGMRIVALLLFCLALTFGWAALGYEQLTGHELIFSGQDLSLYTVDSDVVSPEDGEKIITYLSGLRFEKITGKYAIDYGSESAPHNIGFFIQGPDGISYIILEEEWMFLFRNFEKPAEMNVRCLSDIDWDYLESIIS